MIKHRVMWLAVSLLLSLNVESVCAKQTPFLQFERSIIIENIKTDTDFAVSENLLVITGNASLFLVDKKMVHLFPGNSLAPTKSVCIDTNDDVWLVDANNHDVIKLSTVNSDIKRIGAGELRMHTPTDISCVESGAFVWEKSSGHYAYLDHDGDLIASGRQRQAYQCAAKDLDSRVCINTQQDGIQLYQLNQLIAQYKPKVAITRYSDISIDNDGLIWVSDAIAGQLQVFSEHLQPLFTSELISDRLKNPQRISVFNNSIWLLDSAQNALIKLSLRHASSAFEHQLLAEEYYALGNMRKALEEVAMAGMLAQPKDDLKLLKAKVVYGLQDYQQSILILNTMNAHTDDYSFWLGNAYFRLKQLEQAVIAYRNLESATAQYNLGVVYLEQNKYELAQSIFESLLKLQADDHWARLALIETYINTSQFDLVLQNSESLLEYPEIARQAHFYMGLALYKTGQAASAISYLQRASQEGPYYTRALRLLADAYTQQGDSAMADKTRRTIRSLQEFKQMEKTITIKDQL